ERLRLLTHDELHTGGHDEGGLSVVRGEIGRGVGDTGCDGDRGVRRNRPLPAESNRDARLRRGKGNERPGGGDRERLTRRSVDLAGADLVDDAPGRRDPDLLDVVDGA